MKKLTREEQIQRSEHANSVWKRRLRRRRVNEFRKFGGGETVIKPPAEFSFTTNYEQTVDCLRKLKKAALQKEKYRGHRVSIEFEPIKRMSIGAALVLAAEIDRWKRYRKARLSPKNLADWDPGVRKTLQELGFFELLGLRIAAFPDEDVDEVTVLPMISGDTLDRELLAALADHLVEIANGFRQDLTIYPALIEAAYNSMNHAYPEGCEYEFPILGKTWWATGQWSVKRSEVKLLVFDQGVGIAATLPRWERWEKVRGWISDNIPGGSAVVQEDARMIEAALEVSRTSLSSGKGQGLKGRGQGLKDIITPVEAVEGARVRILSGRGQISYTDGGMIRKYEHSQHIGGTLIEWTIPVPEMKDE